MTGFDHDPELPAGFQDSDLEYAGLVRTGRREARLRRMGLCAHGWLLPLPYAPPSDPRRRCNDCLKVFASEAEAMAERREMLL